MKVIIAGGRNYQLTPKDYARLDSLGITEVVSGGAKGADQCGEYYGRIRGIKVTVFPADWKQYGRSAGPIRNRQMAQYADALAAFHGGYGTQSMRNEAIKAGIIIF